MLLKEAEIFSLEMRDHPNSDKNSHIYKHLKDSHKCRKLCCNDCFTVMDAASTYNHRKIKGPSYYVGGVTIT